MNLNMKSKLPMALITAILAGCSSTPATIRTGDRVELGFTCRLTDGEIAATTKPDSAVAGDRKSPFYLPRTGPETVTILAGPLDGRKHDRVSFEDEIMNRLGVALVGLGQGDRTVLDIRAERYPAASPKDRFVQLAKVRKRPKELRMSREEYTARTGKTPEAGQSFALDPLVPGKLREVTDKEVVAVFSPEKDKPLTTPFGPVVVHETPTQYELEIMAEKDRLVRTGGMVGRIGTVNGDSFEVDYGHPFGGEKLRCEINIASVKPAEKKATGPEPVAVAASGTNPDTHAEKVFDAGMAKMASMSGQGAGTGEAANSGDLVTLNYTVTLEDGTLVATTLEKTAKDQTVKKVAWFREPAAYAPVELVAGKQELMPGLAEALAGMRPGERKRIVLTPDKAFGMTDPQKIKSFPCSQTFPKTIRMPADEYVKRFSSFPVMNKDVELLPYFKSRVTEVTEHDVALEFQATDGAGFSENFGSIGVSLAKDRITTTLKPLVGAAFPLKDGVGVISATDGTTFTVDFNNPLAGKTIVLELETISVAPAVQGASIDWIDDHDAGLARAKQEGKPVFLMLHADWCGWCKKTFTEILPDPRIMALKDRFVWVRVNSDKELKYKQLYGQNGFPMMVLLGADGKVLKKIDGFREARVLSGEMKAVLN
ncbi:MAG: hypothetical protein CXR30_19130 [Geobacter sp.]|nr:MAG: hypothetical protein CXR30_19130 [Geobacter sp.]